MKLEALLQCNQNGWIPGPKETEEAFLRRIQALDHFFSYPPEDVDDFLIDSDWYEAQEKLKNLYDFSPNWIVAHYSNQNLSFFQGAATWIIQKDDLCIPLIQLKKKFESGRLFRIYRKEEVLAHEAVHAARMQFEQPYFEEILAYQTSPYRFRRFLGPIFQKPWEAYTFIGLLFIPICIELFRFFYFDHRAFLFLTFVPFLFFSFLFLRLLFLKVTLAFCLKHLKHFLTNPLKNKAVALRLTDREIFQFAYTFLQKMESFLRVQNSFRWEMLKRIYFKKM